MVVSPNPDDFFDTVFFVDPLTNTIDDSLVMALSKDPLNADRYSKYLQVRSSSSSPHVDDETNFDLCLPRSVQSLSEHKLFNDHIFSFIKSLLPSVPPSNVVPHDPSDPPVTSDPGVQNT